MYSYEGLIQFAITVSAIVFIITVVSVAVASLVDRREKK